MPVLRGSTIERALHGGEDYELLFTLPRRRDGSARRHADWTIVRGKAGQIHFRGRAARSRAGTIIFGRIMTDPAPILELIEAFRRSKTMFTAVKLGIFDGERPQGAAMDRLLDACVGLGLLDEARR